MKDELYINGVLVELDETNPFPLTFQISDITEPDKRKGANSKTITIPGTQLNLQLLYSIYSLSISAQEGETTEGFYNFDPTIKAKARYYSGGVLQMNGVAQVLNGKKKNGQWKFEISLFSDFINFMNDLKKVNINEFDWSEYNHTLNIANVQASWNGSVRKNGVLVSNLTAGQWAGFGYYYGLIDYGFPRVADNVFALNQIVPQVFPYEILTKSFEKIGFRFSSEFLESDFFKKQVVAWSGGEIPSVPIAIQTQHSIYTKEQNSILPGHSIKGLFPFNSRKDAANIGTPIENRRYYDIVDTSLNLTTINAMNIEVVTDNSSQVADDYPFNLTIFNDGVYDLAYSGTVRLNSRIIETAITGLEATNYFSGTMKYGYYFLIKKNNVVVETIKLKDYLFSVGFNIQVQNVTFDIQRTFNLNTNDVLSFELQIKTAACQGAFDPPVSNTGNESFAFEYTVSITSPQPTLNLVRTATNFVAGQTVDLRYFVPQMDAAEYFRGIFKQWNLQIMPDPNDERLLLIEPLEDFYKGTDDFDDWTPLLDTKKEIEVIPTAAFAKKRYLYQFKDDKDEFNERYLSSAFEQYGSKTLNSNVDFTDEDSATALPFSNKPICLIPNTTLVVPRNYQIQDGIIKPKAGSPFHLFIGSTDVTDFPSAWKIINESNVQINLNSFPYVGHLDNYLSPTFDMNFGVPKFVFYNATTYTNKNLWSYHERFVVEIVDKYGKVLKAWFVLTRSHVNQLDFSRLKMIDGVLFRLQKVSEYDSTKKEASTFCELIRLISGRKSISGTPVVPNEDGEIDEAYENL